MGVYKRFLEWAASGPIWHTAPIAGVVFGIVFIVVSWLVFKALVLA